MTLAGSGKILKGSEGHSQTDQRPYLSESGHPEPLRHRNWSEERMQSDKDFSPTDTESANRVLSLLDLTELSYDCDDESIRRLCAAAIDPVGNVAAVCVWPSFVALSSSLLGGSAVRIASVVNFPEGVGSIETVLAETDLVIADGATEVDLVLPWRAFLSGDELAASRMVSAVRERLGSTTLKVILETGLYPNQEEVARASTLAIDCGADFLKTSTGKVAVSATHDAFKTMLKAIRKSGRVIGIKPSGGIRSLAQALPYLTAADELMGPAWATAETFRFGTSALHDDIIRVLRAFQPDSHQ
jgi:deoxyribose-phosphate aldolase